MGNDNGFLYVLDAELDEGEADPWEAWTAGEPFGLLVDKTMGYVCSSPALSTNVDGDDLWVFVTTRAGGGTLFAFRVEVGGEP